MAILYKYVEPDDDKPLRILRTMRLSASNPLSFNDPFEVRPWFDQTRHDHFAKSHESFYRKVAGIDHALAGNCSMVGIPTEHAQDFGEILNERFREDLARKFRVLCLSRDPKSVLMWGHYTRSQAGIVLGLDASVPGFPTGLKSAGFDISYTQDRSRTKLPLAYYRSPSVEEYDLLTRRICNNPNQLVESDGGLFIPFSEYRRQVSEACLTALTTKAADWRYEHEVRFIYDLGQADHGLLCEGNCHFAPIPREALREIIVGPRAPVEVVREIVRLFRAGQVGNPSLSYAGCHPNLYEVKAHPTTDKHLLNYFESVLPNR
jgi:hypothetical protein